MPLVIKFVIGVIFFCPVAIYICSPTFVKALFIAEFKKGGFDDQSESSIHNEEG